MIKIMESKNSLGVCVQVMAVRCIYNSSITYVMGFYVKLQVSVSEKVLWDCLDWCVGVYMEWLGPKSKLVIGNAETSAGEEDKGHNVMTSRGYTWTLW